MLPLLDNKNNTLHTLDLQLYKNFAQQFICT
jgi:hypothetical protein